MKISENIEMIDGTIANIYVIKTGNKVIQVDTGMKNNFEKIVQYYDHIKSKPDIVFITHYHMDHIGSLHEMIEKYNPVIISSPIEREYLVGRIKPEKPRSFLGKLVFRMMPELDFEDVKPFDEVNEEGLEFILTRGHTPGSASLFFKSERAVFIGDAAREKNGRLEIDRTFTIDREAAKESLMKIESLHPVLVLPGHGKPVKLE